MFIAELVSQLRTRNIDLDKLAAYKFRFSGHNIPQKEATQLMAKEVGQLMQSWLPTQPVADTASQQRILELEAELAKVKSSTSSDTTTQKLQALHRLLLDELFKDNQRPLQCLIPHACWSLLAHGLLKTNRLH